jgi:hypothetical protein
MENYQPNVFEKISLQTILIIRKIIDIKILKPFYAADHTMR